MNSLQERIAQFRKMANDDPENELGHFRLGQLLQEGGQHEDAVQSFRRTLELAPLFSKVYQLLGQSLIALGRKDEAVQLLQQGFNVADERGDNIPRDEMAKLLVQLDQPAPVSKKTQAPAKLAGGVGGFQCRRPGCPSGAHAHPLPKAPFPDALGQQIRDNVCAECWEYWLRNLSIKVINEMKLDLSTDRGQEMYDQLMKETLGLT